MNRKYCAPHSSVAKDMIEGRLEEKNRLRHSKQALELEHGENPMLLSVIVTISTIWIKKTLLYSVDFKIPSSAKFLCVVTRRRWPKLSKKKKGIWHLRNVRDSWITCYFRITGHFFSALKNVINQFKKARYQTYK